MEKPQVTTTMGVAGLSAAATKLFALFGDYKLDEFGKAFENIGIADAGFAALGLIVSLYAIFHNEDK